MNDDVAFKVGLGGGERELDDTNLGVVNSSGTTGEVGSLLVDEDETIDELRVIDGAAELGRNMDVVKVGVCCGFLVNDLQDGVDGDGSQKVRMVRHDLGA